VVPAVSVILGRQDEGVGVGRPRGVECETIRVHCRYLAKCHHDCRVPILKGLRCKEETLYLLLCCLFAI